ncbi:hypothetical protein TBR22_A39020 [Luteitalea sp. TBR-22]|uniref:cupin domain-containing protein n=1 Tax=Luteitalea sp. TBR-22 TaxID=2802971 RepID=UPI001AF3F86F|nr:cupin domain-containing protein [Luteitalea sp. TBR-22]BCS34676.1 hypothetical protein TBR22_A39020 [Luteitalea sp. TBR-22]
MPHPDEAFLHLENRHTGERLALRRLRRGDHEWLELRGTLPPRSEGPPLHVHHAEDEEGRVLAGTLSVLLDGRTFTVPAGGQARLPRGAAHRWWNAGDQLLRFEGVVTPIVDLDRYLQAMFEVLNASPAGRPSPFYLAHAALRHARTQQVLVMAPCLQPVLFRVIVAVGTVLGRYRGSDWPGCPARCTGAPTVEITGTDASSSP